MTHGCKVHWVTSRSPWEGEKEESVSGLRAGRDKSMSGQMGSQRERVMKETTGRGAALQGQKKTWCWELSHGSTNMAPAQIPSNGT